MEIYNGMVYAHNWARAAAYFLSTCAPEPAAADEMAAYRLIRGVYQAAADDPARLGYKPQADTYFAPWEQQKGREKDIKAIRGAMDAVEGLIKQLFDITEAGEALPEGLLLPAGAALPGRALGRALETAGVALEKGARARLALPAGCASALKKLAAISRAHSAPIADGSGESEPHLLFSRCVFDPAQRWTAMAFDRLLRADGQLLWLCGELEKRGYTRVDCRDGKKISLDYVKQHGKKNEPLKQAWGERTRTGIAVSYEELRLAPCFLWLRMPLYRPILEQPEALPEPVAIFLSEHTKACDGCRYCVQTDKTGARPLAAVPFRGEMLCPHYPGFTMNWRALTPDLAQDIVRVLDAIDALPGM